jgi:hypothetical protein
MPPFLEKEIQEKESEIQKRFKNEISEFKTENVQEVKMDQICHFCAMIGRHNRTMVAAPDLSAPYKRGARRHVEANTFIVPDSTPPPPHFLTRSEGHEI